jgi:dynein heavy chain
VDQFLSDLINYDKDHISEESLKAVKPIAAQADFNPEFIRSKSIAAAGLCAWVINILIYYDIYCEVKPKRDALDQATSDLNAAKTKLNGIKEQVAELQAQLAR